MVEAYSSKVKICDILRVFKRYAQAEKKLRHSKLTMKMKY